VAITAAAMFRRTHGQNVRHRKAPARRLALHHAAVVPAAASRTNFGVRHVTLQPRKSRPRIDRWCCPLRVCPSFNLYCLSPSGREPARRWQRRSQLPATATGCRYQDAIPRAASLELAGLRTCAASRRRHHFVLRGQSNVPRHRTEAGEISAIRDSDCTRRHSLRYPIGVPHRPRLTHWLQRPKGQARQEENAERSTSHIVAS
jgi:hypothetical protein